MSLSFFEHFLLSGTNVQAHVILSPSQPWNHPFLQQALVPFTGEWSPLWAKVGNVYIPYIHKLASVFTKIETCIYLVHTNNTAGFILVLSFSISVTPFSASSHYLQYVYLLDQFPVYVTNLPLSAPPSQALFSHPALTRVPLSPPP